MGWQFLMSQSVSCEALAMAARNGLYKDCIPHESNMRPVAFSPNPGNLVMLEYVPDDVVTPTPAVLVLHGLGENRASMRPLVKHLRTRLDATVLTVGYASPRTGIDGHGASLGRVVAGLPQATRLSFVGHSLGNIVVRRWMHQAPAADLARVHRMVMLGAPNQGSDLARMTANVWLLSKLAHGAAKDLVLHWPEISKSLAVPPCEFGIVAGGKGDDRGYSSLLAGDDDAVVRVAETKLDGACDFLLLPVSHAAMMKNDDVQRATVSFLRTGRFEAPAAEAAPDGSADE